jgi:imidazoleglycerol-phosphate dehydratase
MNARVGRITRKTRETDIAVELSLDGSGLASIQSGIGFLDHLLTALTRHARLDLTLTCKGDLEVDDHHSAEDCALAIGGAIDQALGDRRGIARFGHAFAPMDEALSAAVIDLSGRPYADVRLNLERSMIGELATENIRHVLTSLATAARLTLHVEMLRGANDHHRAEAAFKAVALALRQAVRCDGSETIPSTKGQL